MTQDEIVIVGGARTADVRVRRHAGLRQVQGRHAPSTSARTRRRRRSSARSVDPETIDHVVIGNALQTSTDAIYGARHVGLKAGVPQDVARR